MVADSSCIQVPGAWQHRDVAANGAQFHVVTAGDLSPGRPLVVLLHGFPQFWWAWRHVIPSLADAGYGVAAMDLRGFGGSDKPPRQHETETLARDVAGVIRSLGFGSAVIVGHGFGGTVAWAMPHVAAGLTRGVAILAQPHPVPLHRPRFRDLARGRLPVRALRTLLRFQVPGLPERALRHGDLTAKLLRRWSGPGVTVPGTAGADDAADALGRYREAMRLPHAAYSVMEHFRWLLRSTPRPDGQRYLDRVRTPVTVPTLTIRGEADPLWPAWAFGRDRSFVRGPFRQESLSGAGHFLPEEAPQEVTKLLLAHLAAITS